VVATYNDVRVVYEVVPGGTGWEVLHSDRGRWSVGPPLEVRYDTDGELKDALGQSPSSDWIDTIPLQPHPIHIKIIQDTTDRPSMIHI